MRNETKPLLDYCRLSSDASNRCGIKRLDTMFSQVLRRNPEIESKNVTIIPHDKGVDLTVRIAISIDLFLFKDDEMGTTCTHLQCPLKK